MKSLIRFAGEFRAEDNNVPFDVAVGIPIKNEQPEYYVCTVHSEKLANGDVDIHGACPYQAIELAMQFIAVTLTHLVFDDSND